MEDRERLLHHLCLSLDQHQLKAAAHNILIRSLKLSLSDGIVLARLERADIVNAILIGALRNQLRCWGYEYAELPDDAIVIGL
jgi:hypothetical protein